MLRLIKLQSSIERLESSLQDEKLEDYFQQLEKFEDAAMIVELKRPLLDTVRQLKNIPRCCYYLSNLDAYNPLVKYVLRVPDQLQGLLVDLLCRYEDFEDSLDNDSDYRESSAVDTTSDFSSFDFSETQSGTESDGDIEGASDGFKAKLKVCQTQLEHIQHGLELVQAGCKTTKDTENNYEATGFQEDSEDADDETGDSEYWSEDGGADLERELDDLKNESKENEEKDDDDGDDLMREHDYLTEDSEDEAQDGGDNLIQNDLIREIQSDSLERVKGKTSKPSEMDWLVYATRAHSIQTDSKRNPRGKELEEEIRSRIQLFQQACLVLCPEGFFILCEKHCKDKSKPCILKRKRGMDSSEEEKEERDLSTHRRRLK